MSSETALVVVIALLWGPTMLWLLFRLVRGPTSHSEYGVRDRPASRRQAVAPAVADLNSLVDTYGFWLCESCKSLNRREAKRCYACRAQRDRATPQPGATPNAPAPVPVMDTTTTWTAVGPGHPARPSPAAAPLAAATTAGAPAAASTTASPEVQTAAVAAVPAAIVASAAPRPVRAGDDRGVPVSASHPAEHGQFTTTSGVAGRSSAAAPTTPEAIPVGAAASAASLAAPRAGLTVCPFVGLDGDPSTWFDFPDPNNVCHAIPADDGSAFGRFLRTVGARPSARELDAATQQSRCLTEAHRDCTRYLAAMSVLAVPDSDVATKAATRDPATPTPIPQAGAPGTSAAPSALESVSGETWQTHSVKPEPGDRNGAHPPRSALTPTEPTSTVRWETPSTTESVTAESPSRAPTESIDTAPSETGNGIPTPRNVAVPNPHAMAPAETLEAPDDPAPRPIQDEVSTQPAADAASDPPAKPPAKPKRTRSGRSKASSSASTQPAAEADAPESTPKRRRRTRTNTETAERTPDTGSTHKHRSTASSRSRGSQSPRP